MRSTDSRPLALTVHQPWATLIVAGLKPFEWRTWEAPAWAQGRRVVIHASRLDPKAHVLDRLIAQIDCDLGTRGGEGLVVEPALRLLRDAAAVRHGKLHHGRDPLPRGAGLGTVLLGVPASKFALRAQGKVYAHDHHCQVRDPKTGRPRTLYGWPMRSPTRWAAPVPAKGAQGFWTWPHEVPADAVAEEMVDG
ncbi:ASCH domain-containing protein [Rhodothalassium salexigens]|nr:ASCH domain-containing protein [Rhodothalassium salexigens]